MACHPRWFVVVVVVLLQVLHTQKAFVRLIVVNCLGPLLVRVRETDTDFIFRIKRHLPVIKCPETSAIPRVFPLLNKV